MILGTSFGGLGCAHHFLEHIADKLKLAAPNIRYRLLLIGPSTHFYWNVGAPRALAMRTKRQRERLFVPLEAGFRRWEDEEAAAEGDRDGRGRRFAIVQGRAVAWDVERRTVLIEMHREPPPSALIAMPASLYSLQYHALIICTGSSAHSDLLSLQHGGPHTQTAAALTAFQAHVGDAYTIVIAGGGPSGVEVAGQLATALNFRRHWPVRVRRKRRHGSTAGGSNSSSDDGKRRPDEMHKRIVLLTGARQCLPQQRDARLGYDAERLLCGLGVKVVHNVRVERATQLDPTASPTGRAQTHIALSNGRSIRVDLYIPCTGVTPNSAFVPAELKDKYGYIRTADAPDSHDAPMETTEAAAAPMGTIARASERPPGGGAAAGAAGAAAAAAAAATTLRVEGAGARVYALGDVAAYSQNRVRDASAAVPVLMVNLLNDLLRHALGEAADITCDSEEWEFLAGLRDDAYRVGDSRGGNAAGENLLCPITRFGGVGVWQGHRLRGFAVHLLKGKNYGVGMAKRMVEFGWSTVE